MLFENDSKPLFDIALSDVAAATVNKNEVQLPSPITRMRYSSPISLFSNTAPLDAVSLTSQLANSKSVKVLNHCLLQVTLEFHQDEDNDLNLVEMRFYVPPLRYDTKFIEFLSGSSGRHVICTYVFCQLEPIFYVLCTIEHDSPVVQL